jgi:NAD-dependent SIR2 family protein deacetylase
MDEIRRRIQAARSVCALTGVVWFGEGLPADVWDNAHKAVQTSEILLVVGTSAVVYPPVSPMAPARLRRGHIASTT